MLIPANRKKGCFSASLCCPGFTAALETLSHGKAKPVGPCQPASEDLPRDALQAERSRGAQRQRARITVACGFAVEELS